MIYSTEGYRAVQTRTLHTLEGEKKIRIGLTCNGTVLCLDLYAWDKSGGERNFKSLR